MAEDTLMAFPRTQAVLEEFARDIREGYRDKLFRDGHYTTLGEEVRLVDSVKMEIRLSGTVYAVTMRLNDYWKYVEEDTSPHWPPPDAILRWVTIKPVLPRPDANGRIPSPKSLAYLIGRKISREGTEGSHALRETKDAVIPLYLNRITVALAQDSADIIVRHLALR